ncbi:MAG: BamA/OMP85 family outer membrane protein [Candidatus Aminicenantia bacterium]
MRIIILFFLGFALIYAENLKVKEVNFIINGKKIDGFESFVPLKIGEYIDYRKLKEGMENLYKTDEFLSINVEAEKEENFLKVFYILKKKSIVEDIKFEGDKKLSGSKLKGALSSLKEGEYLNPSNVGKTCEEIRSKLIENGFLDAEVRKDIRDSNGKAKVIFTINSGVLRKIKEIRFSRDLKSREREIRKVLSFKEGDFLIPFKIQRDIERVVSYFKRDGYLKTKLSFDFKKIDKKEALLEISGHLGEKITLDIYGAKIPRDILYPLWEGEILEDWALEEGRAKIEGYLKSRGYLFAELKAELKRDEGGLRVIYQVNKGKRYRLHKISFLAENVDQKELENFLNDYTISTFSLWANGELLDTYESGIKTFYENKGFPDVSVEKQILERGHSVDVVYRVTPKKIAFVKTVDFYGFEPFKKDEIKFISGISEGVPYSDVLLENVKETIRIFLMNNGYKNAKVEVDVKGEIGKEISVTIERGRKFNIKKIYISGLRRTKESVIRNMFKIREGETYSFKKLNSTIRNLQDTGIFSEIKIREIENGDDLIIVFILKEWGGYHVGFGLGYLERSGLRGSLELSNNNILGLATSGSSIFQLSPKEKRGVLSLTNKSIMGLELDTISTLWWEREERKSYSFERRGLSFSTADRITDYSLFIIRYRLARTKLFNLSIKESAIDREYRPFYTSSISASYLFDLRDDPFNPSRGRYIIFNIEKAFPLLGAESNFWKFSFNLQHIKNLTYNIIQNSSIRFGIIHGEASVSDRFFAGGSSFRGEKVDELGPKDPETGNPVGGKMIFIVNSESLLPVFPWENLRLSLFLDIGNVFPGAKSFKLSDFNFGSGFGFWYKTPVGPFKIYLGYNFTKPSLKRKGVILFNIGNEF